MHVPRYAQAIATSIEQMKHADHRRLLSRWGKALYRFVGVERAEFARREVGCLARHSTRVVCERACPRSYCYVGSAATGTADGVPARDTSIFQPVRSLAASSRGYLGLARAALIPGTRGLLAELLHSPRRPRHTSSKPGKAAARQLPWYSLPSLDRVQMR